MQSRGTDELYLGNICRSPMAEAVFAHAVKKHNLSKNFSKIDSAGTASYHVRKNHVNFLQFLILALSMQVGSSPDSRSASTCKAHGVPVKHKARKVFLVELCNCVQYANLIFQVNVKDFEEFDYVLCMDESNLSDLKVKGMKGKVRIGAFGS